MIFNPRLTPREMFEKGIMGGAYFGPNAGPVMTNELLDILEEEFEGMDTDLWKAVKYVPKRNKFKVRSGLSYAEWVKFGWINSEDPFGWIEWYIKYNRGRRGDDDVRQIRRWDDFCGPNGRWRQNIYQKIYMTGNWDISPRIQQSLLHWAYEINEEDFRLWLESNTKIAIFRK